MALRKLNFKAGINRDQTNYSNEGGWYAGNKVRFLSGFPQKIGGWFRYTSATVVGICRSLFNWVRPEGFNLMAMGTNAKVYVESGSFPYDITPLRTTFTTPNTDNCFTVTSASKTITVTINSHGADPGDYVTFSGAGNYTTGANWLDTTNTSTTVTVTANSHGLAGGDSVTISGVATTLNNIPAADLNKTHTVVTAPTANTFTIVVTTAANATSSVGSAGVIVTASKIGGIPYTEINAEFVILTTPTANTFTIEVPTTAATASLTAGGDGTSAAFQIPVGDGYAVAGYGWGAPPWGGSTSPATGWGVGALTPIYSDIRLIYFDKYYDSLIFNIRFGDIYIWPFNPLFNTRATLLSDEPGATAAPDFPQEVTQILFDDASNVLLCFGCTPFGGGNRDPLLIRWASQVNYVVWDPTLNATTENSSGGFRIQSGGNILRALNTTSEIVVFTETSLTSLQYTANPDELFSQRLISENISLIGPNTVIANNNIVYWMGADKFYAYDGRISILPCTLRRLVFENINRTQSDQFFVGSSEQYGELWWFYCSANSTVIDSYVVFNYYENIWYYGNCEDGMTRTAWLDSPLRDYPQAFSPDDHLLYNHEYGVDAGTSDPNASLPINSYIESSDIGIDNGDSFILVRRLIPDIDFSGSTASAPVVNLTLTPRNFPGANYMTTNQENQTFSRGVIRSTTVPVEQYTEQVFVRARARQLGFKVESDSLGVTWQVGSPRMDLRTDGTKG